MGNIDISFLRCKHKVLQKYFLKSPFDGKKLSCTDIASLKMSKNVYSRLVYCKISDDIAVDSESQLCGCPQGQILSPRGSIWIKKGVFSPCYERHEYACTRMLAYLFKWFFGKKDSLSA